MSNAALNRKIKADRIYKTLGKMSWQRIVLGVILLVYVFFLSGTASELLFKGGHYTLAERGMVSEKWMEKNKPDTKKLIDAGSLFESGDMDGAYELLKSINTDKVYPLFSNNYSNFCNELSCHYSALQPDRSDELQAMAQNIFESKSEDNSEG